MLGHRICRHLTLVQKFKKNCRIVVLVFTPTNSLWEFQLLTSFPTLGLVCIYFNHSDCYVVESNWGLIWIFSYTIKNSTLCPDILVNLNCLMKLLFKSLDTFSWVVCPFITDNSFFFLMFMSPFSVTCVANICLLFHPLKRL